MFGNEMFGRKNNIERIMFRLIALPCQWYFLWLSIHLNFKTNSTICSSLLSDFSFLFPILLIVCNVLWPILGLEDPGMNKADMIPILMEYIESASFLYVTQNLLMFYIFLPLTISLWHYIPGSGRHFLTTGFLFLPSCWHFVLLLYCKEHFVGA